MQQPPVIRLNRRRAATGLGALGLGSVLGRRLAAAQEATPVPEEDGLACPADPRLGETVTLTGPEGTEVLRLRVDDLRDPFQDYDPARPPQPGQRFVVVTLAAEVIGPRPVVVDPRHFLLHDGEGYLYEPVSLRLPQDAAEAVIARSELSPGSRVEGLLAYAVLRDAVLARLFYQPERLRLLLLADLR